MMSSGALLELVDLTGGQLFHVCTSWVFLTLPAFKNSFWGALPPMAEVRASSWLVPPHPT